MPTPDLQALSEAFREHLGRATTVDELEEVRRAHIGRKSPLKACLKTLRDVPPEERPGVAKRINDLQQEIEASITQAITQAQSDALNLQLSSEWADLTLPGLATPRGARHPISVVEDRLLQVLRQLGFDRVEGPEVDHPFYNFDALNIPEHHPARDMQDTFWVSGGYLLRSHTTTVQARVLEQEAAAAQAEQRPVRLPIRVASLGRVYRNEAVDSTHTAMFHQFEGIWVDRGLTFAHLKGTLAFLARALYGDRPIRFKPKFYPYTEPSVGLDLQCGVCSGARVLEGRPCEACHGAGWVTILGAGMIHPKVFRTFGYDPDEVQGIAFGMGTTRMASQAVGLTRSKSLYEQDLRVFHRLQRGKS